jgi:hypothetical protein
MDANLDMQVIIESITCPLSTDIMTDPVQGNDGQTYEGIDQPSGLARLGISAKGHKSPKHR